LSHAADGVSSGGVELLEHPTPTAPLETEPQLGLRRLHIEYSPRAALDGVRGELVANLGDADDGHSPIGQDNAARPPVEPANLDLNLLWLDADDCHLLPPVEHLF